MKNSGPDVAKGVTTHLVNSHIDMAPTILQMLGVPDQDSHAFDGTPIPYTEAELSRSSSHELVQVESWTGLGSLEGITKGLYYNNTYKSLRLISDGNNLFYSVWCTGEREFYNMVNDPSQMENRLATPPRGMATTYYGRLEAELFTRLDALLMVTKSCKENSCRDPWTTLFPNGEVKDLADAMRAQYDTFFADQPKVSFSSCKFAILDRFGSARATDWNKSQVNLATSFQKKGRSQ